MAQLEGTENRITVARNRYIKTVQDYNVTIRSFPTNLTAMAFGYKEKPNFSVENEKEISTAPKVDFNPDGESLPAPAPRQQQSSDFLSHIDLLNPFTLFAVFIVSTILRTTLGRLIGAVATGGIVGALAWLIAGSLAASFIAAIIAFLFTMFAEIPTSSSGRGSGRGWCSGGLVFWGCPGGGGSSGSMGAGRGEGALGGGAPCWER